jgi:uncharacterized protein
VRPHALAKAVGQLWTDPLYGLGLTTVSLGGESTHRKQIETWRQEREARLKDDEGWLTVAGLYWLNEGENSVGTGPTNDIILPAGSAPAQVGGFAVQDGKTTFKAAKGVTVMQHGKSIRTATLVPALEPAPPQTMPLR